MADIFLSYARVDQEWVTQLAAVLASRGLTIWRDVDIKPSDRYRQATSRELAASRAVVVVWSRNSVRSDWVLDEAEEGRRHGKLVPIIMDGTEMPFGFRQIQAIDLSNWRPGTLTIEIDRLVAGLSALQPGPVAPDPDPRMPEFADPVVQPPPPPWPIPPPSAPVPLEHAKRFSSIPSFPKLIRNSFEVMTRHYVDFSGRVGRARFWYYMLVCFVISLFLEIATASTIPTLPSLFNLAILLPSLGMGVRRLHDANKSGFYILVLPAPYVLLLIMFMLTQTAGHDSDPAIPDLMTLFVFVLLAAVGVMIYFWVQPGDAGDNRYGPPPPAWTAN